jgi:hypothetical protein
LIRLLGKPRRWLGMWRGSRGRRYVLSHFHTAEKPNSQHETNVYAVFVGCRNPQSPRNRFHDQACCAQDEEGCCLSYGATCQQPILPYVYTTSTDVWRTTDKGLRCPVNESYEPSFSLRHISFYLRCFGICMIPWVVLALTL